MSVEDPGAQGLAEIDKVIAQRPHKDDYALSETTKQLCILRDTLIADRDRSGSAEHSKRLEHLNAIISIVIATHFPLGETPWEELTKARGWLSDLNAQRVQA